MSRLRAAVAAALDWSLTSSVTRTAVSVAAAVVLVGAPLFGWFSPIRLPALLLPPLVIWLAAARPWRWSSRDVDAIAAWTPSPRTVAVGVLVTSVVLAWILLTRFRSGDINAIDFTVYYDRPIYQTAHGRPLFVETADSDAFSHRSLLGIHAYYNLVLVAPLYRIWATPYWLLALSIVAVVLGSFHSFRIIRHASRSGLVAAATAFAFLLNANTARALLYGFHPEVLYAWFIPAAIDAALCRRRWWFLAAVFATATVKEDAILPLFALSITLALAVHSRTRERWLYLAVPPAIGLANLIAYYAWVWPVFAFTSAPVYAGFWSDFGPTPARALLGMLSRPIDVAESVATSGLVRVLLPHAFLPIVGWRWSVGILPLIILYGASSHSQLRAFGIYYAIVTVPFLAIASGIGALTVTRRLFARDAPARVAAALVVCVPALLVYGDRAGYSLRPWRAEVAATPHVVETLSSERAILVQSALYPHAGYDSRVMLLTRETLRDPKNAGAAVLLAPALDAYPFTKGELDGLTEHARTVDGIMVARIPTASSNSTGFPPRRQPSSSPWRVAP